MELSFAVSLLAVFLLFQPSFSTAKRLDSKLPSLHHVDLLNFTALVDSPSPTVFFEVTKPIELPRTKPCSYPILQHEFGYTYGKSPVLANYTPPSNCPSQHFSKIVLEWKATCKGRQFDRIFGVWLGGVEILRSCTAEPRPNGIIWTVEKDITRYYSVLMQNQTLAVYLGNLLDNTYTGVYHVDVTVHFYPSEKTSTDFASKFETLPSAYGFYADLILPISRNLPLNDGLWFEIENTTDIKVKQFQIPKTAYRAVLEIYISFHENDESWYTNPPTDYIEANNLSSTSGNGPFREVVVSLDGHVVGAVWPFTVIYTGGVNPLLWRPITGIGSFNLPSYDIELTPSLGKILDGKSHTLEFSVTNALNVWYVDANLHIWLDGESAQTEGELSNLLTPPLIEEQVSNFTGPNGKFFRKVKRSIQSTGWVKSSYGNITTQFVQHFDYQNSMVVENGTNKQIVNQTIHFNDRLEVRTASCHLYSIESLKTFPMYLSMDNVDQGNGTFMSIANLTLEFDEDTYADHCSGSSESSLKNLQIGESSMVVKNNLVVSGLGSTQQVYDYKSEQLCYTRNVSSLNYTILYDKVETSCDTSAKFDLGFGFRKSSITPSRRELTP